VIVSGKRIILIRHGRSSFPESRAFLKRDAINKWREGYDAAGILDDDRPPDSLIGVVGECDYLMASDLARAVQSMQRLAPNREAEISSLLRETELPVPVGWLPLPISVWGFLIHLTWGFKVLLGTDGPPAEIARARDAAAMLEERSGAHSHIAVVTHGLFRGLLARQLTYLGWRREPGRSYRNWSVWALSRNAVDH
jgi:broad specificity phosphatase PhoE